jgi:hypothetical protein
MIPKSIEETKMFDKLIRGKTLENAFYSILNLDFEEDDLTDFQEFLCALIDITLTKLEEFPPTDDKILNTARTIKDLKDKDTFKCGSIYYIKMNKNDCFYIMGDIHGDKNTFQTFFEKTQFFKNPSKDVKLVFLGDYIDRGLFGLNVLTSLIYLKMVVDKQIILLRGNHEIWEEQNGDIVPTALGDNMFLEFWKDYFNMNTIKKIKEFFDKLPVIVLLSNEIVLVHAGIPRPIDGNYNYIENLNSLNEKERLYEIMWSRPEEKDDVFISYGSPHFSFAKKQFVEFMNHIGGKLMIRGHDPEGFKEYYDGKLITIFSTGGSENETAYEFYRLTEPYYLQIFNGKIYVCNIFPYKPLKTNGG